MMCESVFCGRCNTIYVKEDESQDSEKIYMDAAAIYMNMHDYCPGCRSADRTAAPEPGCCDNIDGRCIGCKGKKFEKFRMYTISISLFPVCLLLLLVYLLSLQKPPEKTRSNAGVLSSEHQGSGLVKPEIFMPTHENVDSGVRDVLQDFQTSFVPLPVSYEHVPKRYTVGTNWPKRDANDNLIMPLFGRLEGNVSKKVSKAAKRLGLNMRKNELGYAQKNGSLIQGIHDKEDYAYPSEDTNMDEDDYFRMLLMSDGQPHDGDDDDDVDDEANYLDVDTGNGDVMPEKARVKLPCNEDENDDDDDLDLHFQRDYDSFHLEKKLLCNPDGDLDFHNFWRGGGDKKRIRQTQAKIMKKSMDTTANPCEDFYQYACGNWEKLNPIPKDEDGYDTFEKLRVSFDSILRDLLDAPMKVSSCAHSNITDATEKAKILYQSCMNSDLLVQRGTKPLLDLVDKLGGWPILHSAWNPENFDWLGLTAQLRRFNNDILIAESVGPYIKNSDEYVIHIDQTSLGLPTRDYFLSPSNFLYLEAYKTYMMRIADLLGAPSCAVVEETENIIDFETELAKITISTEDRHSVGLTELHRRMTIGELRSLVPQIDWYRYLTIVLDRDILVEEPVVVLTIKFFESLVNLLAKTPPRVVANYLLWRFVRHRVNNLDDRFLDVQQDFHYTLFGREKSPPRWKYCVGQVNNDMGMAVGAMFARSYFDEKSKNDTLEMTEAIMNSFRELLKQNNWIDAETKDLARLKIDAMLLRIGYPNFILDPVQLDARFIDITLYPDEYFENTLKVLQHLTRAEQDRLGGPVNKTVWNTAPAVVNAYYSRTLNQIMFPAGILQPLFYHRFFPRSLNYGGIGVVIGHEITHGFDDKGRHYDHNGNYQRWWHDESIENFHERAQCIIDQYSNFVVEDVNMAIDGISTQGENIADNGGIKQAYRAYKNWMGKNKLDDETLPGMNATCEQLFFINFAQVWCGSMRPEAMRNKLKTAVHSPGKFRVIGSLSNCKDFARVFKCPTGSPMNPKEKCSVW